MLPTRVQQSLIRTLMRRGSQLRRLYWQWRGQPITGTAAVAFTPAGKLILIRQTYMNGWCLPGGGRGACEDPISAAERELREEIGLVRFSDARLTTTVHRPFSGVPVAVDIVRFFQVEFAFKPNLEVEAVQAFNPALLPDDLNPWAVTLLQADQLASRDVSRQ